MSWFRRKSERRQPENAELRREIDAQHKTRTQLRAFDAELQTSQNDIRIAQVEAAVLALSTRLRGV